MNDGAGSSGILGLLLLLCVLHGCFTAAMAALDALGGSLKGLSEQREKLCYYAQNQQRLRETQAAEFLLFSVCLTAGALGLSGALRNAVPFPLSTGWSLFLTGLLALLLALLCSGLSCGLGQRSPEQTAASLVGFVRILAVLLTPVRAIFSAVRYLTGGAKAQSSSVTEEEIIQMVEVGNETGVIEESQREMIHNIFEFDDIVVSDVMTHRMEMVAVRAEEPLENVLHTILEEGYSRLPVYEDSIDSIVGILMAKDLLCLAGKDHLERYHIRQFLRDAVFVPETAKCKQVLKELTRKKAQIAIVVDEYGGTAGVVSMEDLLEEIVGNIEDEYDEEEVEIRRVSDSVYLIQGTADPDDVLPHLGISLPEGQTFDTMSGFFVELLGRIPHTGETPSVECEGVLFTVLFMEDNWVSKLKAELLPTEKTQTEKGNEQHEGISAENTPV